MTTTVSTPTRSGESPDVTAPVSTVSIELIPADARHKYSALADKTFAVVLTTQGLKQWEIKATDTDVPRDQNPTQYAEAIAALAGAEYRRPRMPLLFIYADGCWSAQLAPRSVRAEEPADNVVRNDWGMAQEPITIRYRREAGSRS